jgi:hypothetical protein
MQIRRTPTEEGTMPEEWAAMLPLFIVFGGIAMCTVMCVVLYRYYELDRRLPPRIAGLFKFIEKL